MSTYRLSREVFREEFGGQPVVTVEVGLSPYVPGAVTIRTLNIHGQSPAVGRASLYPEEVDELITALQYYKLRAEDATV